MDRVNDLVEEILELDEVERIEFVEGMKDAVSRWKERCESQLRWIKQLEELGFRED